ncbi:hypothetical protein AB0F17_27075 [Nonomuraea sp. NPDC026600]|uniref:hypothetical protein n=1 Tax=Nonomuraea sp. NPDC026600 TaxID=3155363 RepID=UPI0033FB8A7D
MERVRPTIRALREDLSIPLPPADDPLDEIDHPLLAKASERFADEGTRHERIRAIDDQILFKVKIQRWRGAVWTEQTLPWLIAAGLREEGSGDDFYAGLERDAVAARARYNAAHTKPLSSSAYVGWLLPGKDDYERYQLEAATRLRRRLDAIVCGLVRDSLRDGHEHVVDMRTFVLGIQVRAEDGYATYVAVRIVGSAPDDIVAVILARIPGCDRDNWGFEYRLPHRPLYGAEQVWSTLMDPAAAAKILEEGDADR